MRRNLDAIALFVIVAVLLAIQGVSNHAGAFARRAALQSSTTTSCPLQHVRVALHRIAAR